ncbi:hypothetical protein FE257_012970 [Aspergillus nanangensis]|uniref:Zn(2)-C6 fungal-type domain-containing protein n=1 Tax=Aspergillus nanangensis TaxID=2582783 RepID=A0AAD4CFK4_ASPNN|nr:hypothetical protein FE257_012970 [Aspergillus nanangensis]
MVTCPAPPRCRAKRACCRCNARRVKCNVVESNPCENCIKANAPCKVIESRRGKHLRKTSKRTGNNTPPRTVRAVDASSPGAAPVPTTTHNSPVARNESVTTPFPRAANTTPAQETERDGDALFLGESATLQFVYQNENGLTDRPSPEENARLEYPIPKTLQLESIVSDWEQDRLQKRLQYLRGEGVFNLPAASTGELLWNAYFRWFHPCFPVVDRVDVLAKYAANTLSPLLCYAAFSVAAAHCDEQALRETGLASRQEARYLFYNKAKDIYDVDYETDKMTVIQSLFLMSFWRSGQLLDKHTRHWLGVCINLAQSRAMHRCMGNLSTDEARLRRCIWWSIYTRERQASAALGVPNRIRDNDCDIEPVRESDLAEAVSPKLGAQVIPEQTPEQVSYIIEMSKLAQLLGAAIDNEYSPTCSTNKRTAQSHIMEKLLEWEHQLPEHMSSRPRLDRRLDMHTIMLYLAFNNTVILLFRNTYLRSGGADEDSPGGIAFRAACSTSILVEDMLSRRLMRHGDIHLINSLFNALCVHVVHIRRSEGTVRSIAEHRARLCLIGLHELQITWQVTVWGLQRHLFFQALDPTTARRLQIDDHEPSADRDLDTWVFNPLDLSQPGPEELSLTDHEFGNIAESSTAGFFGDECTLGQLPWPWSIEGAGEFLNGPSEV